MKYDEDMVVSRAEINLCDYLFKGVARNIAGEGLSQTSAGSLGSILSMYALLGGDLTKCEGLLANSFKATHGTQAIELTLRQTVMLQKIEEYIIDYSQKNDKLYHIASNSSLFKSWSMM